MRLRSTDSGLLLRLFLALGLALAASSAAQAQDSSKAWTTVGSAGTMDDTSAKRLTLDGPSAFLTKKPAATIRYNIVAVDGLVGDSETDTAMLVRYRATPHTLVLGADSRVIVQLIEVNLFTGTSTTKLVLDSNDSAPSAAFQTKILCGFIAFDFLNNAYYIQAQLSRVPVHGVGIPALQAIRVSQGSCDIL